MTSAADRRTVGWATGAGAVVVVMATTLPLYRLGEQSILYSRMDRCHGSGHEDPPVVRDLQRRPCAAHRDHAAARGAAHGVGGGAAPRNRALDRAPPVDHAGLPGLRGAGCEPCLPRGPGAGTGRALPLGGFATAGHRTTTPAPGRRRPRRVRQPD